MIKNTLRKGKVQNKLRKKARQGKNIKVKTNKNSRKRKNIFEHMIINNKILWFKIKEKLPWARHSFKIFKKTL